MLRSVLGAAIVLLAFVFDGPAGADETSEATPPACDAHEVEYKLSATLRVSDTALGMGDGTYAIGPGSVVLRLDRRTGRAQMLAYRMTERFTVQTTALFWSTTVRTDTRTHATPPSGCAAVAVGTLSGRTLRWSSPVSGYTTDGTLTCDGSMCGKHGAPPPGRSEFHQAARPVAFAPFAFGADGKTFAMPYTLVSKSESPSQITHVALAGREAKRTCVVTPACS